MKGRILLLTLSLIMVAVSILTPPEAIGATIWPASVVPVVGDSGPDSAVELGVKFRSDSNGTISGIRFYKASTNSGTHIGNLWTTSGTRLATATFTNETASGWQQVTFPTPVAVTANTVYVASYHTNTAHYSCDQNYFATSGVDSPPLHVPANSVSSVNGVYAYGANSTFPSQGWRSSNYWVDVVFSADVTPPVTLASIALSPAGKTIQVASTQQFTATGTYSDGTTQNISSQTTWTSSNTGVATITSAGLATARAAGSSTISATLGGITGSTTLTVQVAPPVPAASSIWPSALPIIGDSGPDSAVELGVKFRSDSNGTISGIRFYKASTNNGTHIGNLWTASGTRLATATFTNETASGWQQVNFATPVAVTANTVYVASYHTNTAHYSCDQNYFATSGVDSPPLHALAAGVSGVNGVYAYGSASSFPSQGWQSSNYWVDVVFSATTQSGGGGAGGWYAGDMHVHRSCGGSPEAVTSLYQKMVPNNLAVISLLADMGNGEVQNAVTDLPLVNGSDASVPTAGRTVHWDAEWHWDAVYSQYAHQALGGHVVSLGLSEAHQIWEEYTYPILNWARQQNAITGFAHMQYLNNGIPQGLDCCTPLEYPVEVALGAADFVSEDVNGSDNAILAYYRLLNCGFRPSLAAGTDYPCNSGANLGSLLTYVQVADGLMNYRNWIDGIAAGRTVVSRNGQNEFMDLKVNGTIGPGGEISLTGGGSVQVTVQWTANQNLSGTIELVRNGVVVASKAASASSAAGDSLSATVNFTQSGWLAARRMGSNGHQLHTGAVFVTVNNAPVRASAEDANFYVQWIDNLLLKTSPGGIWSSYFVNSRDAAQARYQSARALYQQIALEAAGGGTPQTTGTIFTTQVPGVYENDADYELGTRFWSDVAGQITQVRLYTNALEGGSHMVRIWRVNDRTVVSGPHTWSIPSRSVGWKSYTLPAPLNIAANTDYIVAVSNSSDRYYAGQANGFDAPIVNGYLHAYTGSGVYSTVLGDMPTLTWNNSSYFRDVVFVP